MGYEAWIKIGDYSRNNMEMLRVLMDVGSDLYLYMDASNRKTRLKYGSKTEQTGTLYSSGSRNISLTFRFKQLLLGSLCYQLGS